MWDEQFARRWHERRRINVHDIVRTHIRQSFVGDSDLLELLSTDEMMESDRSIKSSRTDDYGRLHIKWEFNLRRSNNDHDIT